MVLKFHHVRVLPVDGLSAGLRNATPPAVVAPPRASLAEARARPMGLRRHERQQRSTRPAAKLGRGGGWNLEHRPELSSGSGGGGGAEDVPAFPTHVRGGDAPRAWEVRDAAAAAAARVDAPPTSRAPPPPAAPPALKAFSGKGWRRAAPGFGDPEDRDALPPSREPKVLVGNLPTDVPPGVVREILQSHCDGMDLGDVPGELSEMYVAVFGPARPKLKRDRGRLHRGFALLVYTTREAAEAAATRMHGVDLHTPSKKTEGGMRPMKATADVGPAMDAAFMAGEQGDDAPPPAPPPPPPAEPPFSTSELSQFPMRHSCLETYTTLPDLSPRLRRRLLRYLSDAVPGLPELRDVVLAVAVAAPQYTRVKELVESVEAFRLIVAYLAAAERAREVRTFFDLACGHGLVGVLLAWAFPDRRVVACDWKRRGAFDAYARAFGAFAAADDAGVPLPVVDDAWVDVEASARPSSDVAREEDGRRAAAPPRDSSRALNDVLPPGELANLEFVEGNLDVLTPRVDRASVVLALHGCNEANRASMDLAVDAGALWCVMPCCIQKDLYLPDCVVSKLADDAKYAFLCGAMAAKYDAQMARCIDRRITNRALMLFGGLSREETRVPVPLGGGSGPFKLKIPVEHKKAVERAARRRARERERDAGTRTDA